MRKMLVYFILFAMAIALRPESLDIGKLHPVQLVSVYKEDGWIVVETDTEDMGRGVNVDDAIVDLKRTTPGVIYMDTAEFLLVREDTVNLIPELEKYLKKNVLVCYTGGGIPLADAATFLTSHSPRTKIRTWETGTELDVLLCEEERILLKYFQKDKNSA